MKRFISSVITGFLLLLQTINVSAQERVRDDMIVYGHFEIKGDSRYSSTDSSIIPYVFVDSISVDGRILTGAVIDAILSGGGIPDAPTDGNTYGRNNAAWVEVESVDSSLISSTNQIDLVLDTLLGNEESLKFKTGIFQNVLGFIGSVFSADTVKATVIKTDTLQFASGQRMTNIPQNNIYMWDSTNSNYEPYPSFKANSWYYGTSNPSGGARLNWDGDLFMSGIRIGDGTKNYTNDFLYNSASYGATFEIEDISAGIFSITHSGTLTEDNGSHFLRLTREHLGNYNLSGNFININDSPTTTGSVSGSVLSATIDGTERISLNPRADASEVAYSLDTKDDIATGSLLQVKNQGTTVFEVKKDSTITSTLLVDSIGFKDGSGYITGIKESDNFTIDSLTTKNLSIGGSEYVDTIIELKEAVEAETFDIINTNKITLAGTEVDSIIELKEAVEAEEFDNINIGGYEIRFNKAEGVHEFVTAYGNVVWQGAFEDLTIGYNNTGSTITNFTPCYKGEVLGDSISALGVAYASIPFTALRFSGVATMDIPPNTVGVLCRRGLIRNGDASSLSKLGVTWLGEGELTTTKPAYPSEVIVAGGCLNTSATEGVVDVDISFALRRQLKTKSYSFTSLSIAAGEYWKAGFYDAPLTDANLTQASTSITYGVSDIAYEAHPFAVYGGAGTVTGGGRVALIVTGTSYDDVTGVQTAADVDTIISDITTAALNIYDEAKKYHGTVTYELVVVEGAPTAYSLDFNYGYSKYDDINDREFYITGIESIWFGDGTDITGFDIELYKHTQTGWKYSAAEFSPGNGVIAQRSVDQAGFLRVSNAVESAWKRSSLNTFIDGDGEEGFLFKVTTGTNSTIQTMDMHIEIALD